MLAWEAAQWQEMAQLGDNSSGDKEKEGTKTETRVKEELTESDGKWEIAKVLCLDNEWSGALSAKTGIQEEELANREGNWTLFPIYLVKCINTGN